MYGAGPGRWNDYRYAAGVVAFLLRHHRRFDIVYFLMPGIHVAAAVPVAGLLGLRCVMKFAGSSEIRKVVESRVGAVELASLRRWCGRIMVLNDGMVQEAIDAGFDRNRLLWMPNPVDTAEYAPCDSERRRHLRERFGIPQQSPVAVFVGRFAPEKEIHSLIRAFASVAAVRPDSRLALVGDGQLRSELEGLAATAGVADRIIFPGAQPSAEVCQWLQASDVFTLVSRREGLPVSLIEAMATGLPAVVSDIPGTAQLIVDGTHGFRVPVRDEKAIATALGDLFGNALLRAQFGAAARPVVVDKFSTSRVLAEYERLFNELIPTAAAPWV
jgi:glycosyltransferase involved in cell wall biosynthesis